MQITVAVFAACLAQYASAIPAPPADTSAASQVQNTTTTTSTTGKSAGRPVLATQSPVAAADTNRTIVDLGITPSVLRIPVKPNPNFTPNVTNAVAAAQAKYVLIEEQLQLEKRRLQEQVEMEMDLEKREPARPVLQPVTTTTKAGRPALQAAATTTTSFNALYCMVFPAKCAAATTTAVAIPTTAKTTTTTSTTPQAIPTTSSTTKTPTITPTPAPTSTSTTAKSLPTLTLAAQDIQLDSEFLSVIQIGSNNDTLDVVMDTGSADLWMFSTDCVGCSSSHNFYRPSLSTTFKNTTTPFSLAYGDGSTTSGLLGFDTVTIAGAPIQAQSIDVAHHISASLQSNAMDGILGLGFPNLMSVQNQAGVTTPLTAMANQKLIASSIAGLQYVKSNHWSYTGGGGAWTFGGIDNSVISGSLNTVPLTQAQYWMISAQAVSIGSAYSYTPTQNVIVDSGTTLILLDPSSVAKIHAYLPGGRVSPDNSHYQIFCNASSSAYTGSRNAYFTLNGVKYGVPASDLAWYPESATPGYCYSGIQPWSNSFGILGAMFLKNVYAVFDQTNSRMQFANRVDVAALSD